MAAANGDDAGETKPAAAVTTVLHTTAPFRKDVNRLFVLSSGTPLARIVQPKVLRSAVGRKVERERRQTATQQKKEEIKKKKPFPPFDPLFLA